MCRSMCRCLVVSLLACFLMIPSLTAAKYSINGVVLLEVGPEYELKNAGNFRVVEYDEMIMIVGKKVVFQQAGLNSHNPDSFHTYSRIMVTWSNESAGTYPFCDEEYTFSDLEKDDFIKSAYKSASPWDIYGCPNVINCKVNGFDAIQVSYNREGNHGGTHVDNYFLYNNNQFVNISVSYAIPDSTKFLTSIRKTISSFSWVDPQFSKSCSTISLVERGESVQAENEYVCTEHSERSDMNGYLWKLVLATIAAVVLSIIVYLLFRKIMNNRKGFERGRPKATPPPLPAKTTSPPALPVKQD